MPRGEASITLEIVALSLLVAISASDKRLIGSGGGRYYSDFDEMQ